MKQSEMIRRALACAGLLFAACASAASSKVYVDKAADAALADGSSAHPYVTIQAGVDAVAAGGTVYVAPGDYDTGSTNTFTGCDSRVLIWKNLTLQARGSRTATIIRGAAATTSQDAYSFGLGTDAIRCITVASGCTVWINGFTICDGRSHYDSNGSGNYNANFAGGVYGSGYSTTYLQDSIIRNCYATRGGGARHCRVIRCFMTLCKTSNVGVCLRDSLAFNSIFARNGGTGGGGLFAYSGYMLNCTVVENPATVWGGAQQGWARNCAFFRNGAYGGSSSYVQSYCVSDDSSLAALSSASHCVTTNYESCILSPLTNDFRVVAGSACDGTGDYSMGGFSSYTGAPKDFFGKERRNTSAQTVCVGAVEATAAPVDAPPVKLVGGNFAGAQVVGAESNGWFGVIAAGKKATHLNELAEPVYPSSIRLRLPGEGDSLGNLLVTNTAGHNVYINYDNTVDLPRYPLGSDGRIVAHGLNVVTYKDHVLYVDAAAADGGDGSNTAPYNTLQAAADKLYSLSSQSSIVYVRKGTYDKGGKACLSAVTNRLTLYMSSLVRVVATDGPEQTTIVGASDPTDAAGNGPAAVRCVEINEGTKILSGFTLAGGRSGHEATLKGTGRGGAANRSYNAKQLYLTDCVITNCAGETGSATYYTDLIRCRVTDCGRGCDTALCMYGTCVSTLFWNNGPGSDVQASSLMFNDDIHLYNCTVGADSHANAVGAGSARNTVIDTGSTVDATQQMLARPFHYNLCKTPAKAIDPTAATTLGSVTDDARFKAPAAGDHRLLDSSSGQGLARWSEMSKGCPCDCFGVPYSGSSDGTFVAGAVEGCVAGIWVDSSYAGGVEPSGSCAFDGTGELALAAAKADKRPLLGFTVNGTLVETRNPSFTLRASDYPRPIPSSSRRRTGRTSGRTP